MAISDSTVFGGANDLLSGVLVMDYLQHPIISDPRLFAEDRLHASELGHER